MNNSVCRAWRRLALRGSVLLLSIVGCRASSPDVVPDVVARLPQLGAASSAYQSAMRDFTRDLENWAVRAGHPASAEALIGPMFLRSSPLHAMPAAADTGLEGDYQRLDLRFADLLDRGDSVRHAASVAREQVLPWLQQHGTAAGERTESFRAPVYPPPPTDTGRGTVALQVKCAMIKVSVLASKEGVSVCILKEKRCTRMPADNIGDAWWAVTCLMSCFDYIGWVPAGGGFTVGAT